MKFRSLLVLGMLLCLCLFCPSGDTAAQVQPKQQVVRVGFFQLNGYHMLDENGTPSGYGYDYLQNIATYTGWKYTYVGYDKSWREMMDMLEHGEIDLLTAMRPSPERSRLFLFSQQPLGQSASVLTISSDNTTFPIGSYALYNGMHVGFLGNSVINQSFEAFAAEHGFRYKSSLFGSPAELSEALNTGEVDAILTSNISFNKNHFAVDFVDYAPFYAAVSQSRPELIAQFNAAQEQLRLYSPQLESKLWAKYYTNSRGGVHLSHNERAYLASLRTHASPLKVLIHPDRAPLSYVQGETFRGIIPSIARRVFGQLDLPYELVIAKDRHEYTSLLHNQQVDICFDFSMRPDHAEQYGYQLVGEYLSVGVKAFRRADTVIPKSIAVIDGDPQQHLPFGVDSAQEITPCSSYSDCISAVLNGSADITYINTYSADMLFHRISSPQLVSFPVINSVMPFSAVYLRSRSRLLGTALQKSVLALESKDIVPLVLDNITIKQKSSFQDYLLLYRTKIIWGVLFVALLLLASWLVTLTIFRQKAQLEFLNTHDPLTGLLNRTEYSRQVQRMLHNTPKERFAFVLFDIDRFQLINTFFGRAMGDRLLVQVGKQLKATLHQYRLGLVGRIGADVFSGCICYDSPKALIDQFADFQHTIKDFSQEYDVVTVFGVYFIEHNNEPVDEVFGKASLALKSVKGNYVHAAGVYTPSMSEQIAQIQLITDQVRVAIEQEQFEIFLQPKFSLITRSWCGAEALVRWRHPQKGLISPAQFIPVFEANGFITKLDYYIWERVCHYLRARIDARKTVLPISVNLSRVSLRLSGCVAMIEELVDRYGIEHRLFEIEITESAYMQTQAAVADFVAQLRQKGFTVLMDDFGSGCSSLRALHQIQASVIKIDMLFLAKTEATLKQHSILSSVIDMAHQLGRPVVVEGVETIEQVITLRDLGCQIIQGYYFSRPVPKADYDRLIDQPVPASLLKGF